jgi:magnesium transporter
MTNSMNSKLINSTWKHLRSRDMESLKKLLAGAEIIEILELMMELSSEEQAIIFRLLSKDIALEVFEELDTSLQHNLLSSFTEERVIEMVSELAPDDRVRLLDELPAKVAKKLLASLSTEEREATAQLMGYEPETAGRIMTTEYVRLKRDITVERALQQIRENESDKETIYTLYVTDDRRKLEGVLSLRELVTAQSSDIIENIMKKSVVRAATDTDQEEVVRILQELDLLALPIVDKEERLVGIITVDDAMDIQQEETTEDIFDKAGLADLNQKEADRSEVLVAGSYVKIWRVRLPFLMITLVGGLLAGAVVGAFEDALQAVTAIAVFIPVIMDMGGNAGTQSSTIFAIALILGHIDAKRFGKHLLKETFVGLSMGVIAGVIAGIAAAIWQQIPALGWAVALALTFTMTLATTIGFLIPFILYRLDMDQAAGADPIITTIKDITGLVIYFVLVTLFLGNV